jgi:chaperonin cofactor prefoldin
MKKHYSKKLKEEIERLEKDIYKIIDGDFLVTTHYKLIRQIKQDLEKVIWSGDIEIK